MDSEAKIQSDCVTWLRNSHPGTHGLFFSITNNSEHVVRGAGRKALGMIAGVADTCFLWRGMAYFIEFKTESGKQSLSQVRWAEIANKAGFSYSVVRSLAEFKLLIEEIINKPTVICPTCGNTREIGDTDGGTRYFK